MRRKHGLEPLLFSKGKERQDRENSSGLARLNNASRLWAAGVAVVVLLALGD